MPGRYYHRELVVFFVLGEKGEKYGEMMSYFSFFLVKGWFLKFL